MDDFSEVKQMKDKAAKSKKKPGRPKKTLDILYNEAKDKGNVAPNLPQKWIPSNVTIASLKDSS